jgi:hypothetical protein
MQPTKSPAAIAAPGRRPSARGDAGRATQNFRPPPPAKRKRRLGVAPFAAAMEQGTVKKTV